MRLIIFLFIICCCSAVYSQIVVPQIDQPHPRLLMKQADIDIMNQRITNEAEPWYSAYVSLKSSADNGLSSSPDPYTGRDSSEFYQSCRTQGTVARNLAIAYLATGNDNYAQKAISYISAWSTAEPLPASDFDPEVRYANSGMEVPRSTIQIIWAYDLLYDHLLMTPEIKADFESWLRVLQAVIEEGINRWEINDYFGGQYYQNHLASHAMGLLMIGYVLGDRELVQYAVDSPDNPRDLVELIAGCILMEGDSQYYYDSLEWPVHDGEIIDRYRHVQTDDDGNWTPYGLAYSSLTLNLLLLSAEMTYVNGLDFYSYTAPGGENLLLPFKYYAEFYIEEDACVKDGFYCGENVSRTSAGFFELANMRYPDETSIVHYLNSIGRSKLRTDYIGTPVLTHGSSILQRPDTLVAHWDMNNTDTMTYLDQTRNYVPDNTEYNHKFILGYTVINTGVYGAALTADGEGVSGLSGDKALWFNGMYSGAFSSDIWPDAENAAIELYIKPYSFQYEQTIVYATGTFELRLVPTSASTARINFNLWHKNGVSTAYSLSNIVLDEWNHVKFFAGNGKAVAITNSQSGNIVNISEMSVSYDSGIYFGSTHLFNTRFYSGLIDELSISYLNGSCALTGYAKSDINRDCYVDILDVALIAQQWLVCTNPTQLGCVDMSN
ncbi:MAG: alginate lyase family protein [Sedimentisphaeraceae bacterium JB056]